MEQSPKINKAERDPDIEIEQKYLLAAGEDSDKLEEKLKQLFPNIKLVDSFSEISNYFPRVTKKEALQLLPRMMRYRRGGAADILTKLDKVPEDILMAIRLRHRSNPWKESFVFSLKASSDPLHDTQRIEVEINDVGPNILHDFAAVGLKTESMWHSMRKIYTVDENITIDIQDVSGYGWTVEIESNDLNKVQMIANQLGLKPISLKVLGAMYKQYVKDWRKYLNGQGHDRHFSEADWKEIESSAGEGVVKNQIA